MYCLKCGKEIQDEQVFCASCLDRMAQHPIKPGTAIQIHNRPAIATSKVLQIETPPEEQIAYLRKTISRLRAALIALLLLLALAVGHQIHAGLTSESEPAIGRNYSTSHTTGQMP